METETQIKPRILAHIVASSLKNDGEKLKLGGPLTLRDGAFYLGEQILMPLEVAKKVTLVVLKTLNHNRSQWENVLKAVVPLVEQAARDGIEKLEALGNDRLATQLPATGRVLLQPDFRDVLPPRLEAYCWARSEALGVIPDGVVGSVLAYCCAALPSGFRLKIGDDYEEHATLWMGVVGKSSTKKTPALKSGLGFFQERQAAFEAMNRKAKAEYKQDMEIYKAAVAKAKVGQKIAIAEPEKPRELAILETDATIEALLLTCADNPRGVLYFRDEMSAWLAQITRRDAEKERATWLEGYNASPYSQSRIGRGRVSISCYRTVLLGGVQPAIVRKLLSDDLVDGLAARLILLRNDNTEADPTNMMPRDLADYLQIILARLFDAPSGHRVGLTPDGQQAHARHCSAYARQLRGMPDSHYRAFLGKRPGLLARITLLLAALEAADAGTPLFEVSAVGSDVVDRAAKFVELFIQRSAAIIYQKAGAEIDGDDGVFFNERERKVIAWLKSQQAKGKTVLALRDLLAGCRAFQELRREKRDYQFVEALSASALATIEPHGRSSFLLTLSPYLEELQCDL